MSLSIVQFEKYLKKGLKKKIRTLESSLGVSSFLTARFVYRHCVYLLAAFTLKQARKLSQSVKCKYKCCIECSEVMTRRWSEENVKMARKWVGGNGARRITRHVGTIMHRTALSQ